MISCTKVLPLWRTGPTSLLNIWKSLKVLVDTYKVIRIFLHILTADAFSLIVVEICEADYPRTFISSVISGLEKYLNIYLEYILQLALWLYEKIFVSIPSKYIYTSVQAFTESNLLYSAFLSCNECKFMYTSYKLYPSYS